MSLTHPSPGVQEQKTTDSNNAETFTRRTQSFIQLSRQMTQAATDFEIACASLAQIRKEHSWVSTRWKRPAQDEVLWAQDDEFITTMLDLFDSDSRLHATYGKLYEDRSKLGVNEASPSSPPSAPHALSPTYV